MNEGYCSRLNQVKFCSLTIGGGGGGGEIEKSVEKPLGALVGASLAILP